MIHPSSGQIVKNSNESIGYLPQNPKFHKGVSGIDFLIYLSKINDSKNKNSKEGYRFRSLTWLNNFEIPDKFKNLPIELYSEGMKRRTALAITFMHNPDILLLDEPLENLDSATRTKVIHYVDQALNDQKIVIIATHDLESFSKLNPIHIHIKNGKISNN